MSPLRNLPFPPIACVVGGTADAVETQLRALERIDLGAKLGVELRADLCASAEASLSLLKQLKQRRPVLVTLRTKVEGGRWEGDRDRVSIYRSALELGADLVDAELRSEAARELGAAGLPLVASYHDFAGMIERPELERLATAARELGARAVKAIATAESAADGLRLLEWIGERSPDEPERIGFAMGELGIYSRVLAVSRGAPFTYGSLDKAVAPGQISARELSEVYRVGELPREVKVFGVVGRPISHSLSPHMHNRCLAGASPAAVYLPLALVELSEIDALRRGLDLGGVSVTIPFKEAALRYADRSDERSRRAGAANTLVFSTDGASHAHNTDFEGVVGPLRSRGVDLEQLSVGVIGNGGAARGAVSALLEKGASPTLYYRNVERGGPVAGELGVPGRQIDELAGGQHRVLINATPLGLHAEDRSPVRAEQLRGADVAFDMVYTNGKPTVFLRTAATVGVGTRIGGHEMLVAQGTVQFQLFTGREAHADDFEAGLVAEWEYRAQFGSN